LLVSLGAVTFLSKLRSDIDGNLKSQIDVIVDRLLHVTDKDLTQASAGPRQCIYGDKRNAVGKQLFTVICFNLEPIFL